MGFKDINFGKTAAEKEAKYLGKVFLDIDNCTNQLIDGDKFFIIGPKGSGKSAIGIMLEQMSKQDEKLFVKRHYLRSFPYNQFSELLPKSESPESRYPLNWEFLLLMELIDSFRKDPTCESIGEYDFNKVIHLLKEIGILPNKDLTEIVNTTVKKQYAVDAKFLQIGRSTETNIKHLNRQALFEIVKTVCYSINTNSKHRIIIDGLDDVLSKRKQKEYESLSALIVAADRVNQQFSDNGIDARIIVLCRTDLLNKLLDPNKTKIVEDSGILLEWYEGERDVHASNLVQLINKRASTSLDQEIDVFTECLPEMLTREKSIERGLFEFTRHRPRDIIQLFNKIQNATKGDSPILQEVWDGIHKYSSQWFINEIRDELVGFLSQEEIESTIHLLMAMGKTPFHMNDVETKIKTEQRFSELSLGKIFEALYECNAIGNFNRKSGRLNWKYRSTYSKFDPNYHIAVHNGLIYALNIKMVNIPRQSKGSN